MDFTQLYPEFSKGRTQHSVVISIRLSKSRPVRNLLLHGSIYPLQPEPQSSRELSLALEFVVSLQVTVVTPRRL